MKQGRLAAGMHATSGRYTTWAHEIEMRAKQAELHWRGVHPHIRAYMPQPPREGATSNKGTRRVGGTPAASRLDADLRATPEDKPKKA